MEQTTYKNILIKNSKDIIEQFKRTGFEIYHENKRMHLFSFKHLLIVTLLNMEKDFISRYKTIHTPSKEYVSFYKKRGTNINKTDGGPKKDSINFSLEQDYYDLYYNLMHTFYINNSSQYSNYSSSIFFEEILRYIQTHTLEFPD